MKKKLYLNRPIYVGFTILDLSKVQMYEFHYEYTKQKYGVDAKLRFTDTDSLCYEVKTEYMYEDILKDKELFDTSGYAQDHPLFSTRNKKVLGKMKHMASQQKSSLVYDKKCIPFSTQKITGPLKRRQPKG